MTLSNEIFNYAKLSRAKDRRKFPTFKVISFVILLVFVIVWLSPFVILVFGSLRSGADTVFYPKELIPPHTGYSNEMYIFILTGKIPASLNSPGFVASKYFHLWRWFLNSCISAIGGTLLYLLVASMAAYAFTFIPWKFRNLIFGILVASLVIPGAATSIGNQNTVFTTGLNKSLLALIIPGLGGVYGMYLIKTFFSSIPKELIESSKMDGCGDFKVFTRIVLPLGKTVIYVQGLFGFMGGWNDLIWPQMLFGGTKNVMNWTLQVGIAYVINNSKAAAGLLGTGLAAGVLSFIPVFIVYLIAQNKIIEGMASAGIKG